MDARTDTLTHAYKNSEDVMPPATTLAEEVLFVDLEVFYLGHVKKL